MSDAAPVDAQASTEPAEARSLAEWQAYWGSLEKLTPAQNRRQKVELEYRLGLIKLGQLPLASQIDEIRSGVYERQKAESLRNMYRNRARLAMWKRQGYTFDAQHRLVAPRSVGTVLRTRPQRSARTSRTITAGRARRSRSTSKSSPDGSSSDGKPHPGRPLAGARVSGSGNGGAR
jgi:hypothetical protein